MPDLNHLPASLNENWPVWLLSAVLVVAAVIDGWKLKVPNWITFPLVVGGWVYSTACFGWEGLAGACWAPSSAWRCCCPPTPSAAWAPAT